MRTSRSSRASWRGAEHHERLADRPRLSVGTDRGFGIAVAALLLVLGAIVYWRARQVEWWLLAAAGAIAICAFAAPSVLSPLNRAWAGIRHLLSGATSLVLIFLTYWVVIVPLGLIMRLVGRDRLSLAVDKKAPTYWSPRSSVSADLKTKS